MSSPNFQVVIEHGRIIGTYPMSITLVSVDQSISVWDSSKWSLVFHHIGARVRCVGSLSLQSYLLWKNLPCGQYDTFSIILLGNFIFPTCDTCWNDEKTSRYSSFQTFKYPSFQALEYPSLQILKYPSFEHMHYSLACHCIIPSTWKGPFRVSLTICMRGWVNQPRIY
jgi:hypothetical protein